MTAEPNAQCKLGAVIYGRVSGYPWWPGVVSRCPRTHLWSKSGKYWVHFFNDNAGAWLQTKEIRSFDAYSRDLCFEYNATIAKFRRYQERILKAVAMAEDHIKQTCEEEKNEVRPVRIKVLPPKKSNSTPVEPSPNGMLEVNPAALTNSGSEHRRNHNRDILLKKRPRKGKGVQNDQSISRKPSSEEEVVDNESHAAPDAPRPKRRRFKSSRYADYTSPFPGRSAEEKQATTDQHEQSKSAAPAVKLEPDHIDAECNGEGIEGNSCVPDSTANGNKGLRRSRRRGGQATKQNANGHINLSSVPSRRRGTKAPDKNDNGVPSLGEVSKSAGYNSSAESAQNKKRPRDGKWTMSEIMKSRRLKQERETLESKKPTLLTTGLFVNELSALANQTRQPPSHDARSRVRSRVGQRHTSRQEGSRSAECTDSEDSPERERKVNTGSLEVAAENLVEFAIRSKRLFEEGSGGDLNWATDAAPVVLGGTELVSSILNRISSLEREVTDLKKKAVTEERACLGEDVTAAGVKSAVEALAAASEAFAKAREYNSNAIRQALEVLWPDQQFPLAGADGDLLRTVAQSLILASCKRRYARIHQENEERAPNGVNPNLRENLEPTNRTGRRE